MNEYPQYVPEELRKPENEESRVVLVRGFKSGDGSNTRERLGTWWSTDIFYVLDHSRYHSDEGTNNQLRVWVSVIDKSELERLIASGQVKKGGKGGTTAYQFLIADPPNARQVIESEISILEPLFKDGLARGYLKDEIQNDDQLCETITRALFLRNTAG